MYWYSIEVITNFSSQGRDVNCLAYKLERVYEIGVEVNGNIYSSEKQIEIIFKRKKKLDKWLVTVQWN
jgi:hypothetical protein